MRPFALASLALFVGACIPASSPNDPSTQAGAPRGGLTVDVHDREAVRAFFLQHYVPSDAVPSGWTGNVDTRDPGATTAPFQAAVAERINFFRAMAGVPADVTIDPATTPKAQAAALMMSAQNALSHYPDANWADYTPAGAEAAGNSNLDLERGPAAILAYMRDDGANNARAGHRRWVLFPQTRAMGTGDVEAANGHPAANALWVIEASTNQGPRPPTRDPYVAWPPPGFVPYQLVFARWSLSIADADFSKATISISRDGALLAIAGPPDVENGFGENTIVWEPVGVAGANATMEKPVVDVRFDVFVHGVIVGGAPRDVSYSVTAFDTGANVVLPPLGTPPADWPPGIPTPWGTIPTPAIPAPAIPNVPIPIPTAWPTSG